MKKVFLLMFFSLLSNAFSFPCPIYSQEYVVEYKGEYNESLRCGYQNGMLESRTYVFGSSESYGYSILTEYYPNGMLKSYSRYGSNMSGGPYSESRYYNSSGMLVRKTSYSSSGSRSTGYECSYEGNRQLKCESFSGNSAYDYYEPVDYASKYEYNR